MQNVIESHLAVKKPYDLAAIIIEIKKATVVIFSAGLCIMKFALNIHQVLERQFL